ncbi:MAG: 4Fe-4S dicluster domain-containing protein [Clostridiaceae bacterium]|nr:4Fe-4S dicluster domain-containing protein [Clostridiaceae bacterium]
MNKIVIKNINCVHCGACTAVCNTNALSINNKLCQLNYDASQCTGCNYCIAACPLRIIQIIN